MDDDLRSFLLGENRTGELADLPFWLEAFPDEPAALPKLTDHGEVHTVRDALLSKYYLSAREKRWAYEGLRRLLASLPSTKNESPNCCSGGRLRSPAANADDSPANGR